MRSADHFHITRQPANDWFDRDLEFDTPLFVDPMLIKHLSGGDPISKEGHDGMVRYFQTTLELIATTESDEADLAKTSERSSSGRRGFYGLPVLFCQPCLLR